MHALPVEEQEYIVSLLRPVVPDKPRPPSNENLEPMSSVALTRIYQQSFESHPYYTLAVTNGTLNALGDVVAQSVQLLV